MGVIPPRAGHEVKRQGYPDSYWIPYQVQYDIGHKFSPFYVPIANKIRKIRK